MPLRVTLFIALVACTLATVTATGKLDIPKGELRCAKDSMKLYLKHITISDPIMRGRIHAIIRPPQPWQNRQYRRRSRDTVIFLLRCRAARANLQDHSTLGLKMCYTDFDLDGYKSLAVLDQAGPKLTGEWGVDMKKSTTFRGFRERAKVDPHLGLEMSIPAAAGKNGIDCGIWSATWEGRLHLMNLVAGFELGISSFDHFLMFFQKSGDAGRKRFPSYVPIERQGQIYANIDEKVVGPELLPKKAFHVLHKRPILNELHTSARIPVLFGKSVGLVRGDFGCVVEMTETPLGGTELPPGVKHRKFANFGQCPLVFSHRGVSSSTAPENSIKSLLATALSGVNGAEVDVFLLDKIGKTRTAPELYVSHDKDLRRILGIKYPIVRLLRDPTTFTVLTTHSNCRVLPKLRDVISAVYEKYPRFSFDIELKPGSKFSGLSSGYRKNIGVALGKLLREEFPKMITDDRVVVSSFDSYKTAAVNLYRPKGAPVIRTAKAFFTSLASKAQHWFTHDDKAANSVIMHYSQVTKKKVAKYHKLGQSVGCYTVFDFEKSGVDWNEVITNLVDARVDWIETDNPGELVFILAKMRPKKCPQPVHYDNYRGINMNIHTQDYSPVEQDDWKRGNGMDDELNRRSTNKPGSLNGHV